MLTSKSNTSFSQTNGNQSKCSAWLKDRNRCCERIIAKADRDERDSLLALLTVDEVYGEEQVQKFVDLHFCKNWHRRGGKHAFIRNPGNGWQVFHKIQEGYFAEQGISSAHAPSPSRDLAGNRGGFLESTASSFNGASARSPITPIRMSSEVQENAISPVTAWADLSYSTAEIQRIPISPIAPRADLPRFTETLPHPDERIATPSGASLPLAFNPAAEVSRRSSRIRAQQRLPLEVPRASELGASSVTTASLVPTLPREVLNDTQVPVQATRTSIPTVAIVPPASRETLRRSARIRERTSATVTRAPSTPFCPLSLTVHRTESNPSLPESVAPENHLRMSEKKDHLYEQRHRLAAPRSSQAQRHFLTPRQSVLASRSTNDAQPTQSPLSSAGLLAGGNTASREVEPNEKCAICYDVIECSDMVRKCNRCNRSDVHISCFANWLCTEGSSPCCSFCRDPLSDTQVFALFSSIGGADGRTYRGRYRANRRTST